LKSVHLAWSATSCDFPRFGVYAGLCGHSDHCLVGGMLAARQLSVYTGATVQIVDDQVWPIYYYALRDPSALAVSFLERTPLPNGMRHVSLVFRFPRDGPPPDPAARLTAHPTTSAAFLLTIGLEARRERAFFERALERHAGQTWSDLQDRLCAMARRSRRPRG
jgi:hypothetical protein